MHFISSVTSENEDSSHSTNAYATKNSFSKAFRESAAALPLSLIYTMDDPEDKLDIFNKLVINCLNEHVPLKEPRLKDPPHHGQKS